MHHFWYYPFCKALIQNDFVLHVFSCIWCQCNCCILSICCIHLETNASPAPWARRGMFKYRWTLTSGITIITIEHCLWCLILNLGVLQNINFILVKPLTVEIIVIKGTNSRQALKYQWWYSRSLENLKERTEEISLSMEKDYVDNSKSI